FRAPLAAVVRLGFRHGTRTPALLAAADRDPDAGARTLCACEPVLDAELRHVARREALRRLGDCTLRVRLGVRPCPGAGCGAEAADALAAELDWSAERRNEELRAFCADRWRAAAPALAGSHLAAFEIHRHAFLGARGFAP